MEGKAQLSPRRILFVKHSLAWPRSSGHDVHAFYMMKGLADLGQTVGLTTVEPVPDEALGGVRLELRTTLDPGRTGFGAEDEPVLSRWQEKFRAYWGVDRGLIRSLARQAREFRADAVVVAGLEVLPYLGGPRGVVRVWYAADEWILHHLSQVRLGDGTAGENLREAAVKGAYERACAPLVDRAWVVSRAEQRAMRWLAGVRHADIVPNGVDVDHYAPKNWDVAPRSAVFWGRLDFGPNIQGLQWFCSEIWPAVRARVPDARFTIIGFHPGDTVRALAEGEGIRLLPDLPDLRDEVGRHALVVLPFVSGGGIKNKLLEGAAMAKPILCTPRALGGLRGEMAGKLVVERTPAEWTERIVSLWGDAERCAELGRAARDAVVRSHAWTTTARIALDGINESLARLRR